MSRIQSISNLQSNFQRLIHSHRLPANALLQSLPLHQFHSQEGAPLKRTNLMNGANIRMIQSRSSPSLALKSLQRQTIMSHIIRKEFQRHMTPKTLVLGLINHTHPPAPELLKHAVMGDNPPRK